jgi:hypothetical protein
MDICVYLKYDSNIVKCWNMQHMPTLLMYLTLLEYSFQTLRKFGNFRLQVDVNIWPLIRQYIISHSGTFCFDDCNIQAKNL